MSGANICKYFSKKRHIDFNVHKLDDFHDINYNNIAGNRILHSIMQTCNNYITPLATCMQLCHVIYSSAVYLVNLCDLLLRIFLF